MGQNELIPSLKELFTDEKNSAEYNVSDWNIRYIASSHCPQVTEKTFFKFVDNYVMVENLNWDEQIKAGAAGLAWLLVRWYRCILS